MHKNLRNSVALILMSAALCAAEGAGKKPKVTPISTTATVPGVSSASVVVPPANVPYVMSDKEVDEYTMWLESKCKGDTGPIIACREDAADALGRSNNPKALKGLMMALRDNAPGVRYDAHRYIQKYITKDNVPELIDILKFEDNQYKKAPSIIISRNRSSIIYNLQLAGLSIDQEEVILPYVENEVINQIPSWIFLNKFNNKEIQSHLIEKARYFSLHGANRVVRFGAAEKLVSEAGDSPEKYEDEFISTLKSGDRFEKQKSIGLLGKLRTSKSQKALENAKQDENSFVRQSADEALKKRLSE